MTNNLYAEPKKELLFYCAITMIPSMQELIKEFEKTHHCSIKIIQSGSGDLYRSLKLSKKGDLYLPAYDKYIKENKKDNLFKKQAYLGFNQAAIFTKYGNPKNIKGLDDLLNQKIGTALCNPESGSIGEMTKLILLNYKDQKFFQKVYDSTIEIGIDSRDLTEILSKPEVDMTINWLTTSATSNNQHKYSIIPISENYAPKQNIVITTLAFSQNKLLADAFLDFIISQKGVAVMKKHGFYKR